MSLAGSGLCFGSRRLWRKQHALGANGYSNHAEWLRDWQTARSDEFFVLGSRDETAGCQLCVATVDDDGSLTCGSGCPTPWRESRASTWSSPVSGSSTATSRSWRPWKSNAEYAAFRRQHGEQAVRHSGLGQAISYRFKRDGKGWRDIRDHRHDGRASGYGPTAGRHRR